MQSAIGKAFVVVGSLAIAMCVGLPSGIAADDQVAKSDAKAGGDFPIATIDLQRVLDAHPGCIAGKAKLAEDVKTIEKQLDDRRRQLARDEERASTLAGDSDEFKALMKEVLDAK